MSNCKQRASLYSQKNLPLNCWNFQTDPLPKIPVRLSPGLSKRDSVYPDQMAEDDTNTFPLPLREGGRGRGKATLRSRALRKQSTEAEKKLWRHLRRKQFYGLRFRRQYPLGPYFGDFVCLPARLVIEVDGATHTGDKQAEHDRRRTEWLHSQNFRVLRFWNVHVFENIEDVLDRIDAAMREHPLPPAPSRKRRGEIGMNSRGPG